VERLAALHLAFREMEATPKWPWSCRNGEGFSEREKPWKNRGENTVKPLKKWVISREFTWNISILRSSPKQMMIGEEIGTPRGKKQRIMGYLGI